jgi:hypothetical protein
VRLLNIPDPLLEGLVEEATLETPEEGREETPEIEERGLVVSGSIN